MIKRLVRKLRFLKNPVAFSKEQGVVIGKDCSILGNTFPFGSEPYLVQIGDHVRINDGVRFVTHDGSVWVFREIEKYNSELAKELRINREDAIDDIDLFGMIKIGNNVQIGERAIILPNVNIGDNVIIGACAVVTKDIPNNSVAAGVPAKVIETMEEYYVKNSARFLHTKYLAPEEKKAFLKKYYSEKRKGD